MNIKGRGTKIIAGILTLGVLVMLILAGPANAFNVSLSGFAVSNPTKGDKISTTATIEIRANERMPLPNPAGVFIDDKVACAFSINSPETICDGVTVKLISSTSSYGYGYGYKYGYGYNYGYNQGYSNGKFTYNITIDTSKFSIGEHKVQIGINVKENPAVLGYASEERIITIIPAGSQAADSETIPPTTSRTISMPSVGVDIELNLDSAAGGIITVAKYNSLPSGTSAFGVPGLGKYIQIEDRDGNFTGKLNNTKIKVYYTDAEVNASGLVESSLRLAYYNSTSGTWIIYDAPIGGVDTTSNYVWALTDHFSLWGVFGNLPKPANVVSDSGWTTSKEKTTPATTPENATAAVSETTAPISLTTPAAPAQGLLARITGAIVGTLGTAGTIVVIVFIVGIIILAVTVTLVRRKARK